MGRLYTLDLIRGGAALAVMLYHFRRFVPHGYIAVDLFFVLSGFVLYHVYAARLSEEGALQDFAVRRAIRLGPLMAAGAGVGLLINGGSLWTLLLVPTGKVALFPANVSLWSLFYEVIASLAFAALFRGGRVAWVIVWTLGLVGTAIGIVDQGSVNLGLHWDTALYGYARVAFSFATGVAIASRPVPRRTTWLAVPLTAAVLSVTMFPYDSPLFDAIAVFVVFPVGVALAARWEVPAVKTAAALGGMSYAIYAIQYPLVKLAWRQDWPVVSTIALVIAFGWALARFYDAPLRAALYARVDSGRWLPRRARFARV